MSDLSLVRALLDEHTHIKVSAAWTGSPDSKNPANIARHCTCGHRVSDWPWKASNPDREASIFRDHLAAEIVDKLDR